MTLLYISSKLTKTHLHVYINYYTLGYHYEGRGDICLSLRSLTESLRSDNDDLFITHFKTVLSTTRELDMQLGFCHLQDPSTSCQFFFRRLLHAFDVRVGIFLHQIARVSGLWVCSRVIPIIGFCQQIER